MDAKILVGIPTYDGQKYCRQFFLNFLQTLTYPHLDFLFVTNSGEEDAADLEKAVEPLRKAGRKVTVLVDEPATKLPKLDRIVSSRNIVRDEFLKGGWTHLYFIDSDVVGPKNQVEALLRHGKDVVTGWYSMITGERGKPEVQPVLYERLDDVNSRRFHLAHLVLRPRLLPIASAGLGCTLISKAALEVVPTFRRETGTEDSCFYADAEKRGFLAFCDTKVACWHVKFPLDDDRNALLDPRRYKLHVKAKRV